MQSLRLIWILIIFQKKTAYSVNLDYYILIFVAVFDFCWLILYCYSTDSTA